MPPMASALYNRWWQLETWLRSLVYVELKAALGGAWADALPKPTESRQQREQGFRYMATPDAANRLAYADVSALFGIIQDHWNLFECSLLPKNVWTGRVEELLAIRNRISHCRRPHTDDLVRLEQTLRDLEGGALIAASAFNCQEVADERWTDVVVDGWTRCNHEDAHLIQHAERQYKTKFKLRWSRRPWAQSPAGMYTVSGVAGYIWHANWFFREGRPFDLRRFWQDVEHDLETILLVCADSPSTVEVSFSALENPHTIADTIGGCFDAVLMNLGHGHALEDFTQWRKQYADLDPRIQVVTPWSLIDGSIPDVSLFGV